MNNFYLKVNQEPKVFQEKLETLPQSANKGIYKLYYFEDGEPKTIYRFFLKTILESFILE